jgi:hypothetical protein
MELKRALDEISEIHKHLAKAEVFRDYRAVPVVLSGALALGASALQRWFVPQGLRGSAGAFVAYWSVVAALGLVVAGGGVLWRYLREADPAARRHTRIVVGQFLPSLFAGGLLTLALARGELADGVFEGTALSRLLLLDGIAPAGCLVPPNAEAIALLPGLWALIFGLGLFASRPYLPRAIGFAALYYVLAGGALLLLAGDGPTLAPVTMGITFGLGQALAGTVLYWNLERHG